MTHTELYVGDARGLTMAHLGHRVSLTGSEGTQYEGVLSYLSFDLTRGEDEAITIAVATTDNPLDDKVFHLSASHRITAEYTDGP